MTWAEKMRNECGYEAKTTFWNDFSIADRFGTNAINDTYKRAFKEWKGSTEYLTELVMVLNHKAWQWSTSDVRYSELYNYLWEKTNDYAIDHLQGDDLKYFLQTTD